MGDPINPTQRQIEELRRAAELPPATVQYFHDGKLTLVLPPDGLALVEFRQAPR